MASSRRFAALAIQAFAASAQRAPLPPAARAARENSPRDPRGPISRHRFVSHTRRQELTVYLSAYHFDGDPTDLLPRYDRMATHFPDEALLLHTCVVTTRGISVYDACPTREVHAEFVSSPAWQDALADAGLAQPRIEELGEVHHWVATRIPVS